MNNAVTLLTLLKSRFSKFSRWPGFELPVLFNCASFNEHGACEIVSYIVDEGLLGSRFFFKLKLHRSYVLSHRHHRYHPPALRVSELSVSTQKLSRKPRVAFLLPSQL